MATTEPRIFPAKTGESIVVRTAVPDDARALLSFLHAAAATTDQIATQADEFPTTEDEERATVERLLVNDAGLCLLATHEDRVIGNLSFAAKPRRRMRHAGSLGMLVHHSWRGRGVGMGLLQVLLDWARTHSTIEKVCLSVFDSNSAALALYRKTGFLEEGRRRGQAKLGPDRYVDEVLMGLWVKTPPACA